MAKGGMFFKSTSTIREYSSSGTSVFICSSSKASWVLRATFTHGSELYTTAVCPQNRGDLSYFSPTDVGSITPQGPQRALWLRRLPSEQLPTLFIKQTYIQVQTCLQQFNKYNFNCAYFRPMLEVLQHIFYLSYRNLRTVYALAPLFFKRDQVFFAFKLEIYFTAICSTFFASHNFLSLTPPT